MTWDAALRDLEKGVINSRKLRKAVELDPGGGLEFMRLLPHKIREFGGNRPPSADVVNGFRRALLPVMKLLGEGSWDVEAAIAKVRSKFELMDVMEAAETLAGILPPEVVEPIYWGLMEKIKESYIGDFDVLESFTVSLKAAYHGLEEAWNLLAPEISYPSLVRFGNGKFLLNWEELYRKVIRALSGAAGDSLLGEALSLLAEAIRHAKGRVSVDSLKNVLPILIYKLDLAPRYSDLSVILESARTYPELSPLIAHLDGVLYGECPEELVVPGRKLDEALDLLFAIPPLPGDVGRLCTGALFRLLQSAAKRGLPITGRHVAHLLSVLHSQGAGENTIERTFALSWTAIPDRFSAASVIVWAADAEPDPELLHRICSDAFFRGPLCPLVFPIIMGKSCGTASDKYVELFATMYKYPTFPNASDVLRRKGLSLKRLPESNSLQVLFTRKRKWDYDIGPTPTLSLIVYSILDRYCRECLEDQSFLGRQRRLHAILWRIVRGGGRDQ